MTHNITFTLRRTVFNFIFLNIWLKVTWDAFIYVFRGFFYESYLRRFCSCFKCLKSVHKRKIIIKTVLITSITILLIVIIIIIIITNIFPLWLIFFIITNLFYYHKYFFIMRNLFLLSLIFFYYYTFFPSLQSFLLQSLWK